MMKNIKHIPTRTCVACGRGRGAYLCPVTDCWLTGLKGNRIERNLHVQLSQDNRKRLIQYGESLGKKEVIE